MTNQQPEVKTRQRVFWAVTEGAVAAVLLIGGGLAALQTAAITTGLPFAILLIVMSYSLLKGLREEHSRLMRFDLEKERKSYQETIQDLIRKREKSSKKEK